MMDKELAEIRKTMFKQSRNINKQIEIIKKSQIEILRLKSTVTEMKNSLEGFDSRFEQAKLRILNFDPGHLR